MKKIILIPFILLCISLSAQTLINNKGNRNQSYPVITETKTEIVNLINQVSQDSLEKHIRFMQSFIRNAQSPAAVTIQNYLVDCFESYGYEDISIHYFDYNSQQLDAGDVVVVKKGTEFPDEYILVTAHYDSFNDPGANDDASGTAGVLECARLLKNFPAKRSIIFLPLNGHELPCVCSGSKAFAKKCATENMNVLAVFLMDMIGWFPPDNPNTIMASGYSYITKALFNFYQQTANTYIPSIPTIRFSFGDMQSDNQPFNKYEYPALYIGDYEYSKINPCYHQPCDTLGSGVNRLDLAEAFIQAVIAATAELSNAWLPPQNLSACTGLDFIKVSWDSSGENNSYKVFKNNTMLLETTNNFYLDYDVEVGEKYEYYVVDLSVAPSNKDEVIFVEPLQLPYYNDFNNSKFGFEQSDWVLRSVGEKNSLCNTNGSGIFKDNYLSIAEMDWFPIPNNTENISIRFKWQGNLYGNSYITYSSYCLDPTQVKSDAGLWFEVTNDRKTWHKLAYITGRNSSWMEYEFSLNEFKNSDFFQARFRLESSGAENISFAKRGYITDIEINYTLGIDEAKQPSPYISSFNFMPNPANTYINVLTNQQEPYHIFIYDVSGRIIFEQDAFNDGILNVAHLKAGSYLVVASTKQHRVARKLIIQ